MEYKLQSLESNDRIDHVRGNCQKCSQLHKRCFVFVCLLCALFAFINFLLLIYVVGRSDVEADILKQLHTLQARVQTLEAISSGSLSAVNEARHEVSHCNPIICLRIQNRIMVLSNKHPQHRPSSIWTSEIPLVGHLGLQLNIENIFTSTRSLTIDLTFAFLLKIKIFESFQYAMNLEVGNC